MNRLPACIVNDRPETFNVFRPPCRPLRGPQRPVSGPEEGVGAPVRGWRARRRVFSARSGGAMMDDLGAGVSRLAGFGKFIKNFAYGAHLRYESSEMWFQYVFVLATVEFRSKPAKLRSFQWRGCSRTPFATLKKRAPYVSFTSRNIVLMKKQLNNN